MKKILKRIVINENNNIIKNNSICNILDNIFNNKPCVIKKMFFFFLFSSQETIKMNIEMLERWKNVKFLDLTKKIEIL